MRPDPKDFDDYWAYEEAMYDHVWAWVAPALVVFAAVVVVMVVAWMLAVAS